MKILSVNCVAVVLSTCLIIVSAAVVMAITTTYSISAADDFARKLTDAIVRGGRSRVGDYIDLGVNVQDSMAFAFNSGAFPDIYQNRSRGPVTEQLLKSLSAHTVASKYKLTAVGAGFEDGTWIWCAVGNGAIGQFYCELTDPHAPVFALLPNGSTGWQSKQTFFDFQGRQLLGTRTGATLFDPRTRPWYTAIKAAGPTSPVRVTDVFLRFFGDMPAVSIDTPIVNQSTGQLYGVTAVGLDMNDLSDFLSELPTTKNTATALIDNRGFLLGLSSRTAVYITYNATDPAIPRSRYVSNGCNPSPAGNIVCRHTPATCSEASLRKVALSDPSLVSGPLPTAAVTSRQAVGSDMFYVGTSPVAGYIGVNWRLLTVIPEEDITGEITKGRNLAIILAAVVAVVSSIMCAVALWLLLRPLRAIAERMYEASTLRDGAGSEVVGSRMAEIRTIEDAFDALFGQLKRARSFLPASLLAQLDAETDDQDDEEEATHSESMARSHVSNARTSVSGTSQNRHRQSQSDNRSESMSRSRHILDGSTSQATPSVHSPAAGGLQNAAESNAMRTRNISVLAFNLIGFHDIVAGDAHRALSEGYATMVDGIMEACKGRRGVLDSFLGDRFTITFNAAIGCGGHASAALAVATQIARLVKTRTTAGVSTGIAHVGNMGSTKARRFANIGNVVPQAAALERLAKTIPGASLLVTRAVADDTQHTAQSVYVESVRLPGTEQAPSIVASVLRMHQASKTDEWMYELQETACDAAVAFVNEVNKLLRATLELRHLQFNGSIGENPTAFLQAPSSDAAQFLGGHNTCSAAVEDIKHLEEQRSALCAQLAVQRPDVVYALSTVERLLGSLGSATSAADMGRFYNECVLRGNTQ